MRSASPDIRLLFGQGSPLVDITSWVTSPVSLGKKGIRVDGTTYGDTATVKEMVGMTDDDDVVLEGFFDDADDGPLDLFGTISGPDTPPYTLQQILTAGSPPTTATQLFKIGEFAPPTEVKGITKFKVTLVPVGPVVYSRQGA